VRNSSGTPSRSARPGRRLAPTPRVTARFTSAMAMSTAGIAPSSPNNQSIAPVISNRSISARGIASTSADMNAMAAT
jgi:hypothetical protein